jgi:hypothetical protein
MFRAGLLFLLFIVPGSAQGIVFGLKGGVPLSQAFSAQQDPSIPSLAAFLQSRTSIDYDSAVERTVPYTIGPAVEVRLWRKIGVEADGLYSRAVYDYTSIAFNKFQAAMDYAAMKHTVDQVQIPVLVKYRLMSRSKMQPFAGVGASICYNRDIAVQGITDQSVPGEPAGPVLLYNPALGSPIQVVKVGPVFAAGVVTSLRRLRLSLEARYAWFTGAAISAPALRSDRNQTSLIAGVMF